MNKLFLSLSVFISLCAFATIERTAKSPVHSLPKIQSSDEVIFSESTVSPTDCAARVLRKELERKGIQIVGYRVADPLKPGTKTHYNQFELQKIDHGDEIYNISGTYFTMVKGKKMKGDLSGVVHVLHQNAYQDGKYVSSGCRLKAPSELGMGFSLVTGSVSGTLLSVYGAPSEDEPSIKE